MKRSIITLLTDFGTRDHYVASMKGVILGLNPNCAVVDISHEVEPQCISEAAFLLTNAYSYFPNGTIHVAVVDPGVGSPRKPILLVASHYMFLGPDNGILSLAAGRDGVEEARELKHENFFLSPVSATFHGRDIFAPVAAHLSLGAGPSVFGPKLNSWTKLDPDQPRIMGRDLIGKVLHIDAFGNVVTNIREGEMFHFVEERPFVIKIGTKGITSLSKGYWEVQKGERLALIGSGGFLEISVREGNAQKTLKIKMGDEVRIQIR